MEPSTTTNTQRDAYLYMVQILDKIECKQDMVDLMKKVIDLGADLSSEERNLLSMSYKNIITTRRNGIRTLNVIISSESESETRIAQLQEFRATLTQELDQYCYELIDLVNTKLIPASTNESAKLFYEKLKGDYYRYVCEAKEGEEKQELASKAKECYEKAFEIIKNDDIKQYSPIYLGLVLNYSVFLYEIEGDTQKAIRLAEETNEQCQSSVDDNSANSYEEAVQIMKLLEDNITIWKEATQENKEE